MDNDLIREKILESLYAAHQSGRSRDSQMLGIRDLAQATKERVAGIKENQVAANVSFLVQNELVDEVAIENYFAKKQFGGGKPSYKYRLSRTGLAYFEHGSKYDRSNVFAGIGDISGSGNFIVIGSNNSVTNIANVSYAEGHKLTEDLRRRVNALGELTDAEKVSIQGDLETIKSQLSKTTPDAGILTKAKDNLRALANIAAIAPYAEKLFHWLATTLHI
jgi:hypothetical protein